MMNHRSAGPWISMAILMAACGGDQPVPDDTLPRDLSLAPAETVYVMDDRARTAEPEPAPPPPPPAARPAPRRTPPPPPPPPPAVTQNVAPAPPPAPPAPPPLPATVSLARGTSFQVQTMQDTITSRSNKAGETMTVTVPTDVRDASGAVVIPAGSRMTLEIVELGPSENKGDEVGKLTLRPSRVTIRGESYPVSARVTSVQYELKGRGVQAGDVAKVGIGAAAGAVLGNILGGKKGTIVGGVVGAGAGTAVAVQGVDRDVVILPGARIDITLSDPLEVPRN